MDFITSTLLCHDEFNGEGSVDIYIHSMLMVHLSFRDTLVKSGGKRD